MTMSKEEAKKFINSEEVQECILHHTALAFDNILVYFATQPELGYLRIQSEDEVNRLALSDFLELFYTTDDTFLKLYPKQTLYEEASLSKHFRSAIGFIIVSAVSEYLEVEVNHLWNDESDLYEACFEVAGKRYFELMSLNDLYTIERDYPTRLMRIKQFMK
ncbi:hypothetical protein AUC31_06835 [Planococcus rifietoensis]|uniref:Uncharacterized protein n=1 Tax=Planococcus rifietoensis TaxID=200991 RepID=A0A0U2XDS1_9BACL|nr:hypothetical protein [Planococcus rifietoensis]ALS74959.1 hypothetical protein AUC31_06835 [Planococcus rifietoensis]